MSLPIEVSWLYFSEPGLFLTLWVPRGILGLSRWCSLDSLGLSVTYLLSFQSKGTSITLGTWGSLNALVGRQKHRSQLAKIPHGPQISGHPQTEQINQMNSHTARPLGRVGEFTYSSAIGWSQNSKGWDQISKNPLFQNIGGRGSDLHQILENPCSLVVLGTLSPPRRRKQ